MSSAGLKAVHKLHIDHSNMLPPMTMCLFCSDKLWRIRISEVWKHWHLYTTQTVLHLVAQSQQKNNYRINLFRLSCVGSDNSKRVTARMLPMWRRFKIEAESIRQCVYQKTDYPAQLCCSFRGRWRGQDHRNT